MTIQKSRLIKIILPTIMLFLIGASYVSSQEKADSKPWEGRWILSQVTTPSGNIMTNVSGIHHNYADGKFTSHAMFPGRLDLGSSPTTLEEFRNVVSTYYAGFGTYSVDEQAGTITFSYDGSLRPHRMKAGTTYRHKYEMTPEGLIMTCPRGFKFSYIR